MLEILTVKAFRSLFIAQITALLGTGLLTVALGLLAFDLAEDRAGLVLGTVFTVKMIAYVGLSPFMAAFAARLPRRAFLVTLDLVRASVALCLPFVDQIWQVYLLVFILQTASAGFTPAFQATIPDILPDEDQYTRALSLSRLAYDLENLASPAIAALLLTVLPFNALFLGTMGGFIISAGLILTTRLPDRTARAAQSFANRLTRGIWIYLATPRLRGLLALNMAAAATGAMVLVNTVVLVRGTLGLSESSVALAMAAFGAGSILAALALPRLLKHGSDRQVMLGGATLTIFGLAGLAAGIVVAGLSWVLLLAIWGMVGFGYSATLTPSGRLLRRSSQPEDRAAVFAAHFTLSHACWLLAYPFAGWLMTALGAVAACLALSALAALSGLCAARMWPAADPVDLEHDHPDLPPDHPHLAGKSRHRHSFTIDDLHSRWPEQH